MPFPLNQPADTLLYVVLYVLTLAMHVVFMNYMLAGTAYLAVSECAGWMSRRKGQSLNAVILRDWMPAALSGTITAGIAPLLFLQILYRQSFYTANLLLLHRWMAILPSLLLAFYLMYLQKTRVFASWPSWARAAIALTTLLAVGLVGYSWTENHLLSVRREIWPEFYERGRMFYFSPELLPRLLLWLSGGAAIMACVLACQVRRAATAGDLPSDGFESERSGCLRVLSRIALGGFAASGLFGFWYSWVGGAPVRSAALGGGLLILAVLGIIGQCGVWLRVHRHGHLTRWMHAGLLGCAAVTIVCVTLVREAIRLHAMGGVEQQLRQHEDAAAKGGLVVFLAFAMLGVIAVVFVAVTVRRGQSEAEGSAAGPTGSEPRA